MWKFLIIGFTLSANIVFSQISALTQDGRKVLLYENNTWKYSNNQDNYNNTTVFSLTIKNEITLQICNGIIINFGNNLGGKIEYISNGYQNAGKIKQIGNMTIEYISDGYQNAGKVNKIGYLSIEYISNGYQNAGKVKRIGDMVLEYISDGYQNAGKLKQIGNVSIDYISEGYQNAGKIKSVNGSNNNVLMSVN